MVTEKEMMRCARWLNGCLCAAPSCRQVARRNPDGGWGDRRSIKASGAADDVLPVVRGLQ